MAETAALLVDDAPAEAMHRPLARLASRRPARHAKLSRGPSTQNAPSSQRRNGT
jgi:hypothetical protein